jgi:hypothetical protein
MTVPTNDQIAKASLTPGFAVLARTELSLSELASWDASLQRSPRLLVPVDVQALVVGPVAHVTAVSTETILPFADAGDPASTTIPNPPEPFGAAVNREVGVHLHWAVPDGLARGDAGTARDTPVAAGNPSNFPCLPDRWVVVRLVSGERSSKSWVLEADRADHHDLAGWIEPGPLLPDVVKGAAGRRVIPRDRLNAVAGGDLSWAATYDAVIDRFAFHDDLADLDLARHPDLELSYMVCGWWSEPALDPLHDCTSVGAYQARTRWLGWLAPEPETLPGVALERTVERDWREQATLKSPPVSQTGQAVESGPGALAGNAQLLNVPADLVESGAKILAAEGPAMPRQALLHGSLFGVVLTGAPDLAPDPSAIEVALGPTGFAALSALLADGKDAERASSERVLAAFASGLLSSIDAPGGLAAVDEDRHASGFRGIATGSKARPDRVAEGDVMIVDRPPPVRNERPGTDLSDSPAVRKERALRSKLVNEETRDTKESAARKRTKGNDPSPRTPRSYRDVAVPMPRSFVPADFAFVLRGAVRSFRHGGDGRFTAAGRLACRLPGQLVTGLHGMLDGHALPEGLRSLGSGAVPPEVDLLLREAVLTNPYRWGELVDFIGESRGLRGKQVENRVKAELALRHASGKSRSLKPELDDHAADTLRRHSLQDGYDVSPVGVTCWSQAWVPLWCEWELELRMEGRSDRWVLGPIDFDATVPMPEDAPVTHTVRGRTVLTSSAARALSGQIRHWLSEEDARDLAGQSQISDEREAELAAAATASEGLDVLMGTFHGIRETLLGLDPHDAARAFIDAAGLATSKPAATGAPLLLAGGGATLTRLRVVDAFGRFRDVPAARLQAAEIATSNQHPAGAPTLSLPPRLQRPSRLAFRFVDPRTADGGAEVEARIDQQHADQAVSPVAGWLLPDHVDEGLEFFDSSGMPLGQLIHDELTGAVMWEGAPGRAGPIGGPPDPGVDPGARHVTRLAAGAVQADASARNDPSAKWTESALSALLRAIDTTLWTVDPLGSIGTGAVAGLVGRPIAVVRAVLRLDVASDVDALAFADEAARAKRAQAYLDLAACGIAVRLGELTRSDDGLLAYAVDDDYRQLRLVAPEVRQKARVAGRLQGQLAVFGKGSTGDPEVRQIDHPYVNGPTDVIARSGQTLRLTLLMMPGGKVHATSGVLPRKALALARDWFHDALSRLSPSFRVGPVLVDPTTVRLPMITGLGDKQAFTRRDTPLTWKDDPIVAATQTAYLPEQPSTLREGWIRVQQETDGAGAPGGNAP